MPLSATDIRSPFKFLDPYERSDGNVFFGRQAEVEVLYQAVNKNRIVLLYGRSGTGKTSLVQCGLANKFEVTDWVPFWIRRGADINESLYQALSQSKAIGGKNVSRDNLLAALQQLSERYVRPVYLIFDQFEELLLLGNEEEKAAFLESLQDILSSEQAAGCHLLFVIREEYFGWLESFEIAIPGFSDRRLRVEPMRPTQLSEVITGSCRAFNITLEDPTENVRQIRESLRTKGGIALPYLQVYLDLLYREDYVRTYPEGWEAQSYPPLVFTTEEIAAMGAIEDVLERFLNDRRVAVQAALERGASQVEPDTIARVLDAFVTEEGTKRPIGYRIEQDRIMLNVQAPAYLRGLPPLLLTESLHLLEKNRLLRADEDTYELAHDTLAALIDQQRSTEQRRLNDIRSQIRNSYRIYQETGTDYLSRNQLSMYESYLPLLDLEPHLQSFVDQSQEIQQAIEEADRRKLEEERALRKTAETERQRAVDNARLVQKRTWTIAAVVVIGALVAGYFLISSQQARRQAQEQARINSAVNLAVKARQVFYHDHNLAWHLAAQAYKLAPREETAQALRDMSYAVHPADTIWAAHPAAIVAMQFTEKGDRILTADSEGTLRISDVHGRPLRSLTTGITRLGSSEVAFSPDAHYALIGDYTRFYLWDLREEKIIDSVNLYRAMVNTVAFAPDGQSVAVGTRSFDGDRTVISIHSVDGLHVQDSLVLSGNIGDLAFTTDGRNLLIGQIDLPLVKWSLNSGRSTEFSYAAPVLSTRNMPAGDNWLMANREFARLYTPGAPMTALNAHSSEIRALAFNPTYPLILSKDIPGNILLWNTQGEVLWSVKLSSGSNQLCFAPDGRSFYVAGANGYIYRWAIRPEYRDVPSFPQPFGVAIDISPNAEQYITCGEYNKVQLWNARGERQAVVTDGFMGDYDRYLAADPIVRFSPDGKQVAIAGGSIVSLWELPDKLISRVERPESMNISALAFVPGKRQIIIAEDKGMVRIYSFAGEEQNAWRLDSSEIRTLAVAPDGDYFFAATREAKVGYWDFNGDLKADFGLPRSSATMQRYAVPAADIVESIFSPDGRYLLTGSTDGELMLWDTDGQLIRRFEDHLRTLADLDFSPDGERIVSIDRGGLVNVWELAGLRPQAFQHYDNSQAVAFAADGASILIGTPNGLRNIELWDRVLARKAVPLMQLHSSGVEITPDRFLDTDNTTELVLAGRYFADRYLQEGEEADLAAARSLYTRALSPDLRQAFPPEWWERELRSPEPADLWPQALQELFTHLKETR